MPDTILIEALEVWSYIGVPDEEQSAAQRLTLSLVLEPKGGLRELGDEITKTVDYFAVCEVVKALSATRRRRLIETLAEEVATELLARFPLRAVEVEVRKFILPDTHFVAIRICRESKHQQGRTPPDS